MAHLLFRPHIETGGTVVTTDFIIDAALILPDSGEAVALPVDLLHNGCRLAIDRAAARCAPAMLCFFGDAAVYAAPALCIVDARIDPAIGWSLARVGVSRRALRIDPDGGAITLAGLGADAERDVTHIEHRRGGALLLAAAPGPPGDAAAVTIEQAGRSVEAVFELPELAPAAIGTATA